MAAEPVPGERAVRDDGEPFGSGVVDGGADELTTDAPTAEGVRNAGVDHQQPVAGASEHELGGAVGEDQLEPVGSIVAHDCVRHSEANGSARTLVPDGYQAQRSYSIAS